MLTSGKVEGKFGGGIAKVPISDEPLGTNTNIFIRSVCF